MPVSVGRGPRGGWGNGALALAVATSLLPARGAAAAPPDKAACVGASDAGQKAKKDKRLRAARKELLVCSDEACPAIVKKDCLALVGEIDASLPTIVVTVKDAATGADVLDAKVELDGEPLLDKLDGSAVAVDPGMHKLRVVPKQGDPVEQQILFVEGQKNRLVELSVGKKPEPKVEPKPEPKPDVGPTQKPEPPPDPPAKSGGNGAAWVFGGVGLVALGAFAGLGLSGRQDVSDLRDKCKGTCADSVLDAPKRKLLLADIALGVGIVSFGVATYLFLTAPPSAKGPEKAAVRVDAVPVAGGMVGFVGGRF